MLDVTYVDWLELLGLTEPVADLLAGRRSLTDTRQLIDDAKTDWPSVSQDFVFVLDGLEPFFEEVSDAIAEQTDMIDAFNNAVGQFGDTFSPPGDRLLNRDDLLAMSDIRRNILDRLADERGRMEEIVGEIEDLVGELESLQGGFDEGDPFLEGDIANVMDELDSLQDQLESEGCLG